MKGLQGMIVAAGLGIVGAICNWFYIAQQARDYEKIQFLAVKPSTQIEVGERFESSHFMPVSIPKLHVGNLEKVAIKWDARSAVIGDRAKKTYTGDELILQVDLKTPGVMRPIEKLGKDEVAISVAVDSNSFIAAKVNPGDYIGFSVRSSQLNSPPLARDSNSPGSSSSKKGKYKLLGPFLLLMIGDRTGSTNTFRAMQGNSRRENIITVSVKIENGKFEDKAEALMDLAAVKGGIPLRVVYLPKNWKEK